MTNNIKIKSIQPNWPAPENVHAHTTLRFPSGKFNTDQQSEWANVQANRQLLYEQFALPNPPLWLQQVHSNTWINAKDYKTDVKADACYSDQAQQVCVVFTADCLPILLCHPQKPWVAAIHAGWRGLARNIIDGCIIHENPAELLAWLGPAIGTSNYEIDLDVREAFLNKDPSLEQYFKVSRSGHWLLDLYGVARYKLNAIGINKIYGGNFCTYHDERFFSHRQQPNQGQMASFIWIKNHA